MYLYASEDSTYNSRVTRIVGWYSNDYKTVEIISGVSSPICQIRALKASSSPVIVRLDYTYTMYIGSFPYTGFGYVDFYIRVTGSPTPTLTPTPTPRPTPQPTLTPTPTPNLEALSTLVLPDEISAIEAEAFRNCGFKYVILPDSCREIGNLAFADNANLERIIIPAGLEPENIADTAFQNSNNVVLYIDNEATYEQLKNKYNCVLSNSK